MQVLKSFVENNQHLESLEKIQTKLILSTPEEHHYECCISNVKDSLSLSQWGNSFASSISDSENVERVTLHFYLINDEVKSKKEDILKTTRSNWGTIIGGLTDTPVQVKKVFLSSKTFQFKINIQENWISPGFQFGNKINTGNSFVVVKIKDIAIEIFDQIRTKYYVSYNESILIIHLNFPEFSEIIDALNGFSLINAIDYYCIDGNSSEFNKAELSCLETKICLYREDFNRSTVVILQ